MPRSAAAAGGRRRHGAATPPNVWLLFECDPHCCQAAPLMRPLCLHSQSALQAASYQPQARAQSAPAPQCCAQKAHAGSAGGMKNRQIGLHRGQGNMDSSSSASSSHPPTVVLQGSSSSTAPHKQPACPLKQARTHVTAALVHPPMCTQSHSSSRGGSHNTEGCRGSSLAAALPHICTAGRAIYQNKALYSDRSGTGAARNFSFGTR